MARIILKWSIQRETKEFAASARNLGINVPLVIWIRPETGRSNPGQGEAPVTRRGGLQRCCGQAFF